MTLKSHLKIASAAALALCMGLSGCGSSAGGSADYVDKVKNGEIKGEITFQTWNLKAAFEDYFNGLIADFEKENPGTKVKWIDQPADNYADKLSADASGGTLPDVINFDQNTSYPLAKNGYLMDMAKVAGDAKDIYLEKAWDVATWKSIDGGTYALPWYLATGPSLFNTALFEKAGLDPNDLPKDFDELFDDALIMAKNANGDFSMFGRTPTLESFGEYGVELMNEDQTKFTFNNEKAVEYLNRFKEVYDAGGLLPETLSQNYTGVDKSFQTARIAYMAGSAHNIQQIKDDAPSVYKSLVFTPQIVNAAPNMNPQLVGVSSKTKNPATAVAFAKFVTNAKNQLGFAKEVNIFPSAKESLEDSYFTESDGSDIAEVRVMGAEQIKEAVAYSPAVYSEAMKSNLREEIAKALQGEKSVQQALDDAVDFCNQRLEE